MQEDFSFSDPDRIEKSFRALKVRQPIGDIYVCSIDAKSIQEMSFFDVRRTLEKSRDIERYLGIQRPLNVSRVDDLKRYVGFKDATFPTSLVLAVESDYARFNEITSELTLSNCREGEDLPSTMYRKLCRVLDGQHRIAGLSGDHEEPFEVIVSIFIGSSIADQAYIFATVNLEQTKVNRSLAIDLFDLAKSRSPYRTCHNIAVALDRTEGSPFFRRIKRLGTANSERGSYETITQATFVDGLLQHISNDAKGDRDKLLRGERIKPISGSELDRFPLRNLFAEEQDKSIGKIYEHYFDAVRRKWPTAWNHPGPGYMLLRTNGYRAFASMFSFIYRLVSLPGQVPSSDDFFKILEPLQISDDFFRSENVRPGSSGEADIKSEVNNYLK